MEQREEKTEGAFIGLIVILIILLVGGIYIWNEKNKTIQENQAKIDAINKQYGDSLKALEQDLEKVDTNVGVDANTVK